MTNRHKRQRAAILATALYALCSGGATSAATTVISFDGLPGSNLDAFGSYTESGFLIAKGSGDIFKGMVYGAPVPSLFLGRYYGASTGVIEIFKAGADFTYLGFDLSDNGGSADYSIEGFNNGVRVYSQAGNQNFGGFATIGATRVRSLDHLIFTLTANGSSLNVDNFALGSVPEPASWAMLVAGFGLIGAARRRSRYFNVAR